MTEAPRATRVAIIGTRGIPAKYGGFETFAQELSTRLVQEGFDVIVTSEEAQGPASYQGVKLVHRRRPAPKNYLLAKVVEVFSDIGFMWRLAPEVDVLYVCGTGAGAFFWVPRLRSRRAKIWVNFGGLEWTRTKYCKAEQVMLHLSTKAATAAADRVILDAQALGRFVGPRVKRKSIHIAYGVDAAPAIAWTPEPLPASLKGLRPGQYWIAIARLEPDNNIHTIVEGYVRSGSKLPLVVLGNPTSEAYMQQLRDAAAGNPNVIFPGAIYDKTAVPMLRRNALGYLHGHSAGGTNPSLVEAMGFESLIVAHDNVFNREVTDGRAFFFRSAADVAEAIRQVERDPEGLQVWRKDVRERAHTHYTWRKITSQYVDALGGPSPKSSPPRDRP